MDDMDEKKVQGLIRIAGLLQRRIADPDAVESFTIQDQKILDGWLDQSEENRKFFEKLKAVGFPDDERRLIEYFEASKAENEVKMLTIIRKIKPIQSRTLKMRTASWWAAASILVVLTAITGYYKFRHPINEVGAAQGEALAVGDVLPGGEKAVLTLDNGQKILLDSAAQGQLATQGRVRIVKTASGMISYINEGGGDKKPGAEPISYNTISTPRKGRYQVTLPDGSKVWLNASSSLKYPTRFIGNERLVSLSGEGYFDISPRQSAPFIVETGKSRVEVLGTHFDVCAYQDEPTLRTTLVEGKVRVKAGNSSKVLDPGEQFVLNGDGTQSVAKADTSEVVAWKDGNFSFDDMDLQTAFRQIARWYDVDVEYTGDVSNQKVLAFISRDTRLSLVVDVLSKAGIHCRLDGRKLIVAP